MLSKTGSMMNPYEFRELMAAAVGYSAKTPDEVLAEQEARHKASTGNGAKRSTDEPPPPAPAPKASELAKLQAILDLGKRVRDDVTE